MSVDDRMRIFLRNLPAKLAMQLGRLSHSDMESLYLAARRWESFDKVARAEVHLPTNFKD